VTLENAVNPHAGQESYSSHREIDNIGSMLTGSWESLLHAAERQPAPKACPQTVGHGSALSWNAMLRALGAQPQEEHALCKGTRTLEHHFQHCGCPVPASSTARPANPREEFLGRPGPEDPCSHAVLAEAALRRVGEDCVEPSPQNHTRPSAPYGCHDRQRCPYLRHGCTCQDCRTQYDLPHRASQASHIARSRVMSAPDPRTCQGGQETCQESWKQGYRGPARLETCQEVWKQGSSGFPQTEQAGTSGPRSSPRPLSAGLGFPIRPLGCWEGGRIEPHGNPRGRCPRQQEWDGETSLASPRTAIRNLCQLKDTPAEVSSTLRKEEKSTRRAADRDSYLAPPANAYTGCGMAKHGEGNLAARRTHVPYAHSSSPSHAPGDEWVRGQPNPGMATPHQIREGICRGPSPPANAWSRGSEPQKAVKPYPGQALPHSCHILL
jgi:hypothetical protein